MPDLSVDDAVRPDDLVRWWRALAPSAGPARVLAVDGRSGSGKSTLAAELVARAPEAAVVTMDEVYPGWDGLAAGIVQVVEQLLGPLAAGRPAGVHQWDWAADRPGAWRAVAPAPLLLLEGVGSGALACAPYLAGLIWVQAPDAVRRARALARDGDAYAPHWDRWAAQEDAYLRSDDPRRRADVDTVSPCRPRPPAPPGRRLRPPSSPGG